MFDRAVRSKPLARRMPWVREPRLVYRGHRYGIPVEIEAIVEVGEWGFKTCKVANFRGPANPRRQLPAGM
jgi:hypothetical protein